MRSASAAAVQRPVSQPSPSQSPHARGAPSCAAADQSLQHRSGSGHTSGASTPRDADHWSQPFGPGDVMQRRWGILACDAVCAGQQSSVADDGARSSL